MKSGFLLMLVAMAFISTMDATVKALVEENVPVIQILAIRGLIIVPLIMLGCLLKGEMQLLKAHNKKAQLIRSCVGFFAPFGFFIGLQTLPISDAVVIFFAGSFFITLFSILFLKEKVGVHRWTTIVIGFIGVYIATKPSGEGQAFGYMMVLLSTLCYAIIFVMGRKLSATETTLSLVFWFNATVSGLSLAVLPWYWQTTNLEQTALIIFASLLAFAGHYGITAAFKLSQASLLAPLEYTCLIWAVGFDYFFWGVLPRSTTWIGAGLIIISGCYMIYREYKTHQNTPKQSVI